MVELWTDIVIITTVAQSVQRLLAHMREDTHATRQFHCQMSMTLWFMPFQTCSKRCYRFYDF